MSVKASGRAALILATGLFACFASPSHVTAASSDSSGASSKSDDATPDKSVRQSSRHWKRHAHHRYARAASKSTEAKNASEKDVADAGTVSPPAIPPSVANANALLASADAPADSARAMTAKANTMLLAAAAADKPVEAQAPDEAAVVASDELNDVDRALQQTASTQTVALAAAKPATAPQASGNDNSPWDQTSLIGKIFIAFGALLTMASAARMFMA
jgi:hypothetical protein